MHSLPLPPRLALITLLFGALACRPGGVGQPEIDAVAIVEGDASPSVHTDTIDDAFTVRIDKARWAQRNRAEPGRNFWDDIAVLDIAAAEKAATTIDQKTFVLALRTLMASDPDGAAVAFGALHARATDPAVRARARVGLTMALSWRSDWQGLARIGRDPDSLEAQLEPTVVQAGVERWARALADVSAPEVFVPDEPVTLPMRRSAFGTPVITVHINGRPYEFWLDTGASMTLLSASVAVEAGVVLASPDTLALGVVAGHIPARAVLIDALAIGPVVARGLSAAVVNPGALRLDRKQNNGLVVAVQIDGVIGTDLLRHLDVVLDAGAGSITIRRPRRDVRAPRNLFWVGYPVVKLVTRDGRPVLFGLDTGAEGTFVTTELLRKAPRTPIAALHDDGRPGHGEAAHAVGGARDRAERRRLRDRAEVRPGNSGSALDVRDVRRRDRQRRRARDANAPGFHERDLRCTAERGADRRAAERDGTAVARGERPASLPLRALLGESGELLDDGAPAVMEAHLFVQVSIGVVLVHHVGGIVGAHRMVLQRDDRGHEGLFGRSPSTDQGIREDDPFAIVDGEKAATHVRHELAAVLADPGHERAAGTEVHLQHFALGRRWHPPLLEARGLRPGTPHDRPRCLDDPRYRQVEIRV
jgi:hypothetical protein